MKKSLLINLLIASLGLGAALSSHAHGVEMKEGSKQLKYIKNGEKTPVKTQLEQGINAYFDDVVGSNDPQAPIACGLFRIEKGNPLVYTYDYDDIKLVLNGSITFSDGKQTVEGKKGDVLFFPKGSTITFSTKTSGLAWACGQRKLF
ncbi:cupin domain-containing protein [Methylobacillus sp.]|uniref:cupin domain-containing protein n=1 Tax=Methylobacillus sp. TaxID=56818 RepID=UPI002FE3E1CE